VSEINALAYFNAVSLTVKKYTGLFVPGTFKFLKKKKNQGACPVRSLTQKDHTKPKKLATDKLSSLFRRVVSDEEKS
jgi:hypothetical protein